MAEVLIDIKAMLKNFENSNMYYFFKNRYSFCLVTDKLGMDYSLSAFSFHISWGVGRSTPCNASFSGPTPSPLCFKIWRCTYGPLNSIRIFHHILKCCFLKMTGKTQILNLGSNADAQQKSVIFKVNWCSEISNLSLNKKYYEESSSDTATTFSIIHVNIGIAWSLQMYRNIHLHIYVYI